MFGTSRFVGRLGLVGLELLRRPTYENEQDGRMRLIQEFPHAAVCPQATYSPWLIDNEFNEVYAAISEPPQPYTLVDRLRCYELWKLALRSVPGDVIEIGVWRGGTGCIMAKARKHVSRESTIFLCDTFTGVVGATEKDPLYSDGEHADTSEHIVQSLLDRLDITNARMLRGRFPQETGWLVSDRTFFLVHIDVDVYQSAKDCFDWCWPRLAIGGAIVFDDYGFERCVGVTRFVNEIDYDAMKAILIHNINGHAVAIKTAAS
jgi:O-methyltransferase